MRDEMIEELWTVFRDAHNRMADSLTAISAEVRELRKGCETLESARLEHSADIETLESAVKNLVSRSHAVRHDNFSASHSNPGPAPSGFVMYKLSYYDAHCLEMLAQGANEWDLLRAMRAQVKLPDRVTAP